MSELGGRVSSAFRALLFDIDGTLINSGGAGARSWRDAFEELYGIPADIGAYTDIGMTDSEVGRLTFVEVLHRQPKAEEFSNLIDRRLFYLRRAIAESDGYEVLGGVDELLPRLVLDGFHLGIVTGNGEAAAHVKLGRAELNRFFCFGGYGSDAEDRGDIVKIALARAGLVHGDELAADQCLVIGDTPRDIQAAHVAGVRCVGVASHKFSLDQLRAAGADFVVSSLKDALPL